MSKLSARKVFLVLRSVGACHGRVTLACNFGSDSGEVAGVWVVPGRSRAELHVRVWFPALG